jgi:hypothetical protein
VLSSSNPLLAILEIRLLVFRGAEAQPTIEGQDWRGHRESKASRLAVGADTHDLLLSDKAKEPGVPQAFLCPTIEKAPVVFSGRWVVGVELDHASLPRGSQRYISNFHLGKFCAR